jgi:hypothetical protein
MPRKMFSGFYRQFWSRFWSSAWSRLRLFISLAVTGLNDMIPGRYTRIDFRAPKTQRRMENMKVGNLDDNKIIVTVKEASRDMREKVDGKVNKMFDKIVYKTVDSLDVREATGPEVFAAVKAGLEAAARAKK